MRLCRVSIDGVAHYGVVAGEQIELVAGDPFHAPASSGVAVPLAGARLLPPTVPSKIVAVGQNYRAHAAEMGHGVPDEPLLFLKAPSALLPQG